MMHYTVLVTGLTLIAIMLPAATSHAPSNWTVSLLPQTGQTIHPKEKVVFICLLTGEVGSLNPRIDWRKNNRRLRNGRYGVQIRDQGPKSSALVIKKPSERRHSGRIKCVVTTKDGVQIASADLAIIPEDAKAKFYNGYPAILKRRDSGIRSVEQSRDFELECSADGIPKPIIIWLKDLVPVDVNDDPRFQVLESVPTPNSIIYETCIVALERDSRPTDGGRYSCLAVNDLGGTFSSTAMVYVKQRRVPPYFTDVPDEQIVVSRGSDLALTCNASGSPLPTVLWTLGFDDLATQPSLVLTDVRESANYNCIAANSLASIKYTVHVIVQAPPSPTPPQNITATNINNNSIHVTWDPPPTFNGSILGYEVFYTSKPEGSFESSSLETTTNTETTIGNLKYNTQYYISVSAFSASVLGPRSEPVIVQIPEGVPLSPRRVQANSSSPNSVLVKWSPPPEDYRNGNILGYRVYYTKESSDGSPVSETERYMTTTTTTSVMITGLQPNTMIKVEVSAFSAIGKGLTSEPVTVSTRPAANITEPNRAEVVNVEEDSVLVRLRRPPLDSRRVASHFHIVMMPDNNMAQGSTTSAGQPEDDVWLFLLPPSPESNQTEMSQFYSSSGCPSRHNVFVAVDDNNNTNDNDNDNNN